MNWSAITPWASVIASLITIVGFFIKQYLSDEARARVKEEQRQKDQASHDASVDAELGQKQSEKAAETQQAANAWDAVDAEMRK